MLSAMRVVDRQREHNGGGGCVLRSTDCAVMCAVKLLYARIVAQTPVGVVFGRLGTFRVLVHGLHAFLQRGK